MSQGDFGMDIGQDSDNAITVRLSGKLSLTGMKRFLAATDGFFAKYNPSKIKVDLSGLSYLDSAGALAIKLFEKKAVSRSAEFSFENVSPAAAGILELVAGECQESIKPEKSHAPFLEQVGERSITIINDFAETMIFLGQLVHAMLRSLWNPRSIRWSEVWFYTERVGVDGLPIVGLIGFLIGLIMAFMSSLQLKQFGANVFVASLVAIAMVRELGPIMTAILVAGRSGSSFAAEIGTMKINEEVDALHVMGMDPIRFLAVPKVLASVIVVPLLTIFADIFAIAGGLLVGVTGLNLTVYTYIQQSMRSFTAFDIMSSIVKSVVFAVLIAGIGCQRGFMADRGAEAVGAATTSAVVAGIFLIIVVDSAFAIVLHYIH